MTTLFFVIVIGLCGYLAGRLHSRTLEDQQQPDTLHLTAFDTLRELRAREELEENFVFIKPDYGMLDGQRVPVGKTTREMRENPRYRSPEDLGKWVRKK